MNPVDITLYGIIDPDRCQGRSLAELAFASVENGVTLIQLRDKTSNIHQMIDNAKNIKKALEGTGVPLIINDRVDVALAADAQGVHLGQQDMRVEDARKVLGTDAIIGLSIKTIHEAKNCPVEMLDYAFVGGVFQTQSKDNPTAIGIDGWVERANLIKNLEPDLPIGAIAGIDQSNIASLFKAGCDGVAIISALYMADDVATSTKTIAKIIQGVKYD
ncbi:MAG: thiamine phosphate synthase [Pseudomonadota bacterium]